MSYPVSVKGVLLLDDQVVLVKNPRDEWELPGGRIEADEDPTQTLSREFIEELSFGVHVTDPIDSYLFEVIPGKKVFIVTYACELAGDFKPRISDEHSDYCLWPIERLAEIPLPAGYRRSVERWARIRPE
jgi:8-oxo-dGTP pyrophosphatase MutT (NUDIX family)